MDLVIKNLMLEAKMFVYEGNNRFGLVIYKQESEAYTHAIARVKDGVREKVGMSYEKA
ncbi:hypothetical protein [Candidatus Enterovibrio escicola]|uniref:Uncharacterized protein n=1 Tax=Candidatus Enterovibrio escicola TaxID=1927127 RepID=A0A2A5T316_9GAMM|nr:hypothetical protein [Candidatus Enterovibrio escacola]PCS22563.1 hypothetical protein BTN49_1784 [Candidatus Enterovibrio escacola]